MMFESFEWVARLPADLSALSSQNETGASLRPYVHVFLAYAVAWVVILGWVWRISRKLKEID